MTVVAVTGGRDFYDRGVIEEYLRHYRAVGNVLITGAARGADQLAEQIWKEWQLPYVGVPATWDRSGKAAGIIRNEIMLKGLALSPHAELQPDGLIAFPGGKGTRSAVIAAKFLDIPVWEAV